MKICGSINADIQAATGMSVSRIKSVVQEARKRGFDETKSRRILDIYLKDTPWSGRPTVRTSAKIQEVIEKVCCDRYGREKSTEQLALDTNISAKLVWQILKSANFCKTKPTYKPGLIAQMKKDRLEFCICYKNWTLEDWMNVIWSDETSVVLGYRLRSYRVWRQPEECFLKSTIRPSWKGY